MRLRYLLFGLMVLHLALSPLSFAQEPRAFAIPSTQVHAVQMDGTERTYELYVKTPLGYNEPENASRTYPVIYLNDGPYTFQVASGVTRLPMGGSHKLDRAILVGISFALDESGMASRVRDLTPVEDETWKRYKTGGAPEYLFFLEKQVLPFIEENYRASSDNRTLVGQSLGGSFGAWVLLTRPGLFSNYILTSPSLWYKDRLIFDLEAQFSETHQDLPARVYFAVGSLETQANGMLNPMVAQLKEFTSILEARNYNQLELKVETIAGAMHETAFPQGFTRGVQWIFARSSNDH